MIMSESDFNAARNSNAPAVAIAGGGIIGLACAAELARRGARVTLFDAGPIARGASWAAAGMLAPAFEATDQPGAHPLLYDLCIAGAQVWPQFLDQLTPHRRDSFAYGGPGAIACAADDLEMAALERLASACAARGAEHRWLTQSEALGIEPALSKRLTGALLMPTDQQVDNWAVVDALTELVRSRGVELRDHTPVTRLARRGEGWRVNNAINVDHIVWTTGKSAGANVEVDGQPVCLTPHNAVRPVKGQLVALAPLAGGPTHVLRFGAGYVAPKSSRIVVGATSEWEVDDAQAMPDAAAALVARASRIAPVLERARMDMTWAGVRPGVVDHAPLIGWSATPGVYLATGHYRNGILLAPLTARFVASALLDGRDDPLAAVFAPDRILPEAV